MATKKTEEPVIQEEVKTEAPKDAWQETVSVRVPRHRTGEEEQHYVCINGKAFLVAMDGKVHDLPLPVAEAMQNWLDNEAKVEDLKEKIEKKVDTINGIKVI